NTESSSQWVIETMEYAVIVLILLALLTIYYTGTTFFTLENKSANSRTYMPKIVKENTNIEVFENISIESCKVIYNKTSISIETYHPLLAKNIRWPSLPIKVYVDEHECTFGEKNDIINGINKWNTVLDKTFFVITNNSKEADVIAKCTDFIRDYTEQNEIVILGEAKIERMVDTGLFNISEDAVVYIKTRSKKCIEPVTVIHEFGHILGLDHVNDTKNIMYPYEDCDEKIENYTIETIKNLYSFSSLAELAFENISVDLEDNKLIVNGLLRNYGPVASSKTNLVIYVDDKTFYTLDIQELKPGEGIKFTVSGFLDKPFKQIIIYIDEENSVSELFENNNEFILKC
ncbi:MAG: matrixin family metalloprotease, partial [Candidatus Aenigmarchaeota archaeon]|nr:matrixin family metalloprotease [Candidatus Aenigmarchaeota archaeon]